jgi:hypothetical protein
MIVTLQLWYNTTAKGPLLASSCSRHVGATQESWSTDGNANTPAKCSSILSDAMPQIILLLVCASKSSQSMCCSCQVQHFKKSLCSHEQANGWAFLYAPFRTCTSRLSPRGLPQMSHSAVAPAAYWSGLWGGGCMVQWCKLRRKATFPSCPLVPLLPDDALKHVSTNIMSSTTITPSSPTPV